MRKDNFINDDASDDKVGDKIAPIEKVVNKSECIVMSWDLPQNPSYPKSESQSSGGKLISSVNPSNVGNGKILAGIEEMSNESKS